MLTRQNVDSGSSLHTQLWIDPVEEFLQYAHAGNPVDVTFGVKELKVCLYQLVMPSIMVPYFLFTSYIYKSRYQ